MKKPSERNIMKIEDERILEEDEIKEQETLENQDIIQS